MEVLVVSDDPRTLEVVALRNANRMARFMIEVGKSFNWQILPLSRTPCAQCRLSAQHIYSQLRSIIVTGYSDKKHKTAKSSINVE